jgi:hypothetical protein
MRNVRVLGHPITEWPRPWTREHTAWVIALAAAWSWLDAPWNLSAFLVLAALHCATKTQWTYQGK